MCKVSVTHCSGCKSALVTSLVYPCAAGFSSTEVSCNSHDDHNVSANSGHNAQQIFCRICFHRMENATSGRYDDLICQAVEEGRLAGWSSDEIGRACQTLRKAEIDELDALGRQVDGR